MADYTVNILKPSVNNLTVRVFMRAARSRLRGGRRLGQVDRARVHREVPAAPDAVARGCGLPRGTLGESCAIMAYLCDKHGLDRFYPRDPAERAVVNNAMFYLIGTFYPLLTRATYPTLGFPQYAGEVGDVRGGRRR